MRGVGEFARSLEVGGKRGVAVPAEVQDALLVAASSLETDLRALSLSTAP